MEHVAAVLLIVGCSQDLADCRELPAPVPIFEAYEDCRNHLSDARRQFQGMYPRIAIECIEVDPALEEEDAVLTWSINSGGTLEASIEKQQFMVASGSDRREKYQPWPQ